MQYVEPELIELIIFYVVCSSFSTFNNFRQHPKGLCGALSGLKVHYIFIRIYIWTQYTVHTNTAVLFWWQIFSTHRCWRMALNTHSVPCLHRLRNNNKLTRMCKETQMSLQWSVEARQCLQTLWNYIKGKDITHYTLWQWHIHCVHKKTDFRRNAIYISFHFPSLSLNCAHNV